MTLCASMADRLLDAFPSGSYATVGLLRVFDIVESRDVATACVECRVAPCIKVNPDFVAKHAKTPEHLLMLVLHEVHHVILGHTRMFEGPGRLMNFVFDVVINGMLCRAFNGEAYTSFFTSYYDEGNFPLCLLRPPPGWPGRSDGVASGLNALAPNLRSVVAERHQQIYRFGASYDEVISLLKYCTPKTPDLEAALMAALLGTHDEETGPAPDFAGELTEATPELSGAWRSIPWPFQDRWDFEVRRTTVAPRRSRSPREVLIGLMRKVARRGRWGGAPRKSMGTGVTIGPIPTWGRRERCLKSLGVTPVLHTNVTERPTVVPDVERVHVYVDVSGSVNTVIGALYGAVLDCSEFVHPRVHLFSTEVTDVSFRELAAGVVRTTGGTSIECIVAHMRRHDVRRAVWITDGWVGVPSKADEAWLKQRRIAVAYVGPTPERRMIESFVVADAVLPTGGGS